MRVAVTHKVRCSGKPIGVQVCEIYKIQTLCIFAKVHVHTSHDTKTTKNESTHNEYPEQPVHLSSLTRKQESIRKYHNHTLQTNPRHRESHII